MPHIFDCETVIKKVGNHYIAYDTIKNKPLCTIATLICKGTRASLSPYYFALLAVQAAKGFKGYERLIYSRRLLHLETRKPVCSNEEEV